MILSLLFDMPFKDWFVGVYMHDLVPMLTDTMNEDDEEADDDEANIDEEADDIVIPDNETTRMELQAMEAQILHRRNEGGE